MNLPVQLIMDILACAIGLVAYSYFSTCDPLEHPDVEQRISSPNQVSPNSDLDFIR